MSSKECNVINYGVGNIGSIVNILNKIGVSARVVDRPEDLPFSGYVVLPGVGAFDTAISKLSSDGWIPGLNKLADRGDPILGICLGMHIMTGSSEEGQLDGLGWIDGRTVSFDAGKLKQSSLRLPHMGWNTIEIQKKNIFFDEHELEERFYFVHSYHVVCDNDKDVLSTTNYGYEFVSSFQKDNIVGVQFHPEKSHRFGYEIFKHFMRDFDS